METVKFNTVELKAKTILHNMNVKMCVTIVKNCCSEVKTRLQKSNSIFKFRKWFIAI